MLSQVLVGGLVFPFASLYVNHTVQLHFLEMIWNLNIQTLLLCKTFNISYKKKSFNNMLILC